LRLLDDTPRRRRNDVLDDADIDRILVVTAHPDDVDFGAGGTVATWTKAGYEVTYCIVTNGDAGGFDPDVPRSEIAGIRQAEQRAAAAEVGVTDVRFLGYADGRVVPSLELRRDISRVIREVRPQRLLTQSPQRNYERIYASHPDHLACGEATLCAVYPDARNPFAHPELAAEGHEAWTVSETWLMSSPGAGHAVDVTDVYDRKMAALRSHVSQLPGVPGELDQMLRDWMGANARAAGLPEGTLAEAFQILDTA
jgi:LmbE family N-acetylglucosaminyl deacetylase